MAIGPNVVDDCEGMTEEDYWRGMDEAMQDEEGDEPFCTCSTGHGIEETDCNQCDSCGKPIYDEELAVPPAPTIVVSYGAGTNSTAMLIGMHERGERPDLILFADTGGERPETYHHRDAVSDWCEGVGFPRIVTVAEAVSLETDCLTRGALPGIAYGFKSCSDHYKIRPQKRWLKAQGITAPWFWVGIDAGEAHRAKYEETRYPLIEWDWGRDECVEAIRRAGLPQPGKSACFFCPSSKPHEILELKRLHPDLIQRALAMEAGAELTSVKGLGRSYAWADLVRYDDAQMDMFRGAVEMPCECFDG